MTPAELKRIGRRLFGKGWQDQLALRLHVHRATVFRWASGQTKMTWLTESAIMAIALKKEK